MTPFLSSEQREQFIRDGYVVVSGLIPDDIVAATRDGICREIGISVTDAATWPADPRALGMDCVERTEPCRTAAMDDAATELVGDLLLRGQCISSVLDRQGRPPYVKGFIPVLAFPRPGEKRFAAESHNSGYHVDGIHFVSLWPDKILLVALAYLTDTEPYGGATVVLPGSHRQIFHYWAGRGELPAPENILGEGIPFAPPITVAGKAGDVIFMHHLMVHSGSPNHDDHVRVAINANFTSDPQKSYQVKKGPPAADWTPLDWTLSTDNLAATPPAPALTVAGN